MSYDYLIIGAGITGCSLAFELSKYDCKVLLIDKENDVSMNTTKANSGIVHAGYDPLPNTKMARLNVEGSRLIKELQPLLNFHYKQIGSLVIANDEESHKKLEELYARGVANDVEGIKLIKGKEEVHKIEKNLSEDVDMALYAPTAAVISPWELAISLADTAVINGTTFIGDCKVEEITKDVDEYRVKTTKGEYRSKYVINCAGVFSDKIYDLALNGKEASDRFTISPCKGEYYLLDKDSGTLVNHVIFQTPSALGKGVLVSPTVHGNLIVGPDANYELPYRDYTGNTSSALSYIREQSKRSVSNINFGDNIRNFAGVRANIQGVDDFLIFESEVLENFINFGGIKSPGLSTGPAFGKELIRMLQAKGEKLVEKEDFKYYRLPDYFSSLSNEEKIEEIKKDDRFGQVICRCETVTEGEIVAAIHQPIPATTIDGVKRRTNAGMGRCQGGFCGPKVFEILQRELGISPFEVYQDRTGSNVAVVETKENHL